jgi:hypothetical protein
VSSLWVYSQGHKVQALIDRRAAEIGRVERGQCDGMMTRRRYAARGATKDLTLGLVAVAAWYVIAQRRDFMPWIAGTVTGFAAGVGVPPLLLLLANGAAIVADRSQARQLSGPWGGGYQGIDWNGVYLHNADNVLHKLEHIEAVRSGAIDWRNDAAGAAKVQMYQPYLNEPIFSDVPERRWYE